MSKDIGAQRFKGVENFLRRIAFNLGNTPSQTEVKVISCIPIDVTDLQHKITILEQQLEAANSQPKASQVRDKKEDKREDSREDRRQDRREDSREGRREDRRETTVHPAIYSNTYILKTPSYKNIGCYCCPSSILQNEPTSTLSPKVSNLTEANSPQNCQENSSADVSDMNNKGKCKPDEFRRNIFSRKKKILRKKKVKSQIVCYAQTETMNPFCNLGDEGTSKDGWRAESNVFNGHYMTNVVRKQYAPCPINAGTNVSEYSTPVCRDIVSTVEESNQRFQRPWEPDICSCCCNQFQNIDNVIRHNRCDLFSLRTDSRNTYYDSNFYDVVPVKENNTKSKREYPKRKEFRNEIDVLYWPEATRPSYKTPQVIYHSKAPPRKRKVPIKPQNRNDITVLTKRANINPTLYEKKSRVKTQVKTWTDSFEFSRIYAKQSKNTKHNVLAHHLTDAACLTIPITNTECQTTSDFNTNRNEIKKDITATPSCYPECKTEVTLSQIKNILQTVLNEVKTNSKKSQIPIQMKKDAIVQNGPSQSYMNEGSSLIKSFTYSPYNMIPCGGASSSKQMPNNNLWDANIPQVPVKCLHYPLIIHPEKNMCSCYRNYPNVKIPPRMKCATSAATNTEEVRTRSRETENLIKEIYKSLALHVNMPTKDTIVNRDDIRESIRNFNIKVEDREAKHVVKVISEIFKNKNPIDVSSVTQTLTPLDSKPVSNKCSSRSQLLKNYRLSAKKESVDNYTNDVISETVEMTEMEQMSRQLESDDNYDDDNDEHANHQKNESESSDISETESDDVVVKIQEPEVQKKKGFFSKILKVFQPRSRNRKKVTVEKEEMSTDTDSDDYQTVYSRETSPCRQRSKPHQFKAHSKVIYYSKLPRRLKEKSRRNSPYMEQEYRRNFNERLTFKDMAERTSPKMRAPLKQSPYYQRVEARNAFVDNSSSIYETTQNQKSTHQTNRNEETGFHFHIPVKEPKASPNALSWVKKHKPGLKCGPAWRKFILEG